MRVSQLSGVFCSFLQCLLGSDLYAWKSVLSPEFLEDGVVTSKVQICFLCVCCLACSYF